jgi:hypothetical protein
MAKPMEKVAEKTTDKASADAREPPVMKSGALTWQSEGYEFREAFVRLPAGMLIQDLQDVPAIWKHVQQAPQKALKRFDRVTCVSHEGTWCLKDLLVIDADATRVVLAIKPSDRIALPGKATEGGAGGDQTQ